MGRGRAKAKQTRVARQLKYSGGATDLDRLRSELASGIRGGTALRTTTSTSATRPGRIRTKTKTTMKKKRTRRTRVHIDLRGPTAAVTAPV